MSLCHLGIELQDLDFQDVCITEQAEIAPVLLTKYQCQPQMEGMVTDLQLAKEKQQAFEEWKRLEGRTLGIDITVTVLTIGFWPTYKASLFSDVGHDPSVHIMLPLMRPYNTDVCRAGMEHEPCLCRP